MKSNICDMHFIDVQAKRCALPIEVDWAKKANILAQHRISHRPPTVISTTFCIFFHYLTTHFNHLDIFAGASTSAFANTIICALRESFVPAIFFFENASLRLQPSVCIYVCVSITAAALQHRCYHDIFGCSTMIFKRWKWSDFLCLQNAVLPKIRRQKFLKIQLTAERMNFPRCFPFAGILNHPFPF